MATPLVLVVRDGGFNRCIESSVIGASILENKYRIKAQASECGLIVVHDSGVTLTCGSVSAKDVYETWYLVVSPRGHTFDTEPFDFDTWKRVSGFHETDGAHVIIRATAAGRYALVDPTFIQMKQIAKSAGLDPATMPAWLVISAKTWPIAKKGPWTIRYVKPHTASADLSLRANWSGFEGDLFDLTRWALKCGSDAFYKHALSSLEAQDSSLYRKVTERLLELA